MSRTGNAADVARFRTVLAERFGWTFADEDTAHLARTLDRRAARLGLHHGSYLRQLAAGDWHAELAVLVEELTITETYFFRYAEQFRALAEAALPERLQARTDQRLLRMLSVGCSSGEEAYTLAIVAHEAQPDPGWHLSVLGLDANPAMLRRAADARYSSWSLRETPDAVRHRWFGPRDNGYEVDPRLRTTVQFRQHNVADDDPVLFEPDRYDVVFCRNLLMYLTPATAEALIRRITRALAPGGYLFLGHTDTLGSRPEGLQTLHSHHTFYYRRPPRTEPSATAVGTGHRPASTGPTGRVPTERAPARPGREQPRPRPAGEGSTGADRVAPAARERVLGVVRDERFLEALSMVEGTMPDRPTPADLLLHGVLLAQTGRLDAAEVVARRLVDVNGLYADAHHLLGVCLEHGAAVEVAIGHYRLAAYLDPEFAMPRLRLGLLARRRGDDQAAVADLEPALTLLVREHDERIVLFGGGFGRISLVALCRAELDACGVRR